MTSAAKCAECEERDNDQQVDNYTDDIRQNHESLGPAWGSHRPTFIPIPEPTARRKGQSERNGTEGQKEEDLNKEDELPPFIEKKIKSA